MATNAAQGARMFGRESLVGAIFLGVVVLLMVPVPAFVLDLLLAISIAISAVVFLTALFSERPTDFSIFPTLLLVSTLLRLSLNIASTRLILSRGHEGPDAAGHIIQAFSDFVVGGNLAVGVVVFLALVIINFVVITKGAGRVAEVSARFTLDAMPGKQMAIDAELNAGAINEKEARIRRAEVEQQADFYGAMDGASKFIRGDAVAGLLLTAINLVGGIAIGVFQQGVDVSAAMSTYSLLTIGDGLVAQMPALVVSTAAGLATTRASGKTDLGAQVVAQMLGMRSVLAVSGAFLLLIALLPGLPMVPFVAVGGAMVYAAWRQGQAPATPAVAEPAEGGPKRDEEPPIAEVLRVDPLTLEVGFGLLSLLDASRGGDVPDRVKKLRKQIAQELGVVVPPLRVVDNLGLQPGDYVIKLFGVDAARGGVMADRLMAIDAAGLASFPGGVETKEPVFGLKAFWIPQGDRPRAEARGLTVVDPSTVLTTHLAEVLRRSAPQLLGRDQVHELVGYVRQDAPKLVEELIPGQISLGEVVVVLQRLLAERVSVRNLRVILEAVASTVGRTKNPAELAEAARAALGRQITSSVADPEGVVHALVLDRELEHALRASMSPTGALLPEPSIYQGLLRQLADTFASVSNGRHPPCLLVADELRRPLRELIEMRLPDLAVVALRELDRHAEVRVAGTVGAKTAR